MSASAGFIDLLSVRNGSPSQVRKAFGHFAVGMVAGRSLQASADASGDRILASIAKGAANSLAGVTSAVAELSANYLASLADASLLDALLVGCFILPPGASKALVGTGFTADAIAEGFPKINHTLELAAGDLTEKKPVAVIAYTKELERALNGSQLFEIELRRALTRGMNNAVLDALIDSTAAEVASTGDTLEDLRLGLQAASAASRYVVAASPGQVADLCTRAGVRGDLSPAGGEFCPGITIVPVQENAGMTIIPCDRIIIRDYGMEMRRSEHADLDFSASPTNNSVTPTRTTTTNLWQTNSVGVLAERLVGIGAADDVVIAVVGS